MRDELAEHGAQREREARDQAATKAHQRRVTRCEECRGKGYGVPGQARTAAIWCPFCGGQGFILRHP